MYLPIATFSIVVLGFITIDSRADDFASPTWLQLNGDVLNGNRNFFLLSRREKSVEKSVVSVSVSGAITTRAPESKKRIVKRAFELIGTPYKWGGESLSNGFDCSGLLVYLFRSEVGLELPRTTASMVREDYLRVSRDELQPGDAVFFATNERGRVSHVGLYVGNYQFIHAPRSGKPIRVDSLKDSYWSSRYYGARRIEHQT